MPDDDEVEAMAAIGRPAARQDLPEDLREREKPSDRWEVSAFAFEGPLPSSASTNDAAASRA